MTWAEVSRVTGKSMLADTGYGANSGRNRVARQRGNGGATDMLASSK
jgi:hypothetical protein